MNTRGFQLTPWQRDAVGRWAKGDADGPHRGTLEIFTGGGKTLIALACAERAEADLGPLQLAIVVPTEALARQWRRVLHERTDIPPDAVGLLGAGGHDQLADKRVLVAVLNTAAKELPDMARGKALMLIVDECHRAGAPTFSRVLTTPARATLGLSATPDREEVDELGTPVDYDEQLVGQALGEVVYRFTLADARHAGWLPELSVHHHGVALLPDEHQRYRRISNEVDELKEKLISLGGDPTRASVYAGRGGEMSEVAQRHVAATSRRKDLLYRSDERARVALHLVERALLDRPDARVLVFHERIAEAESFYARLAEALGPEAALEHSRLPDRQREAALEQFGSGDVKALVSVKSLIEGIDVPAADVGISIAASSSVRQRIQTLGRVLRKGENGGTKRADIHLIYVADTVDDLIYGKEDWSDLIGGSNLYWSWAIGTSEPTQREGPPRSPKPSEEREWERFGGQAPERHTLWEGSLPRDEYSVDSRGNVRRAGGAIVSNPQSVADWLGDLRDARGGRFFVTPEHRLVLAFPGGGQPGPVVLGQLAEPFRFLERDSASPQVDPGDLAPGDPYTGPATDELGSYALRQTRGGVVERRVGRDREFALTEDATDPTLGSNASRVLEAWRSQGVLGTNFSVNAMGHAWYLDQGTPRFLANVPGGFEWPTR